MKHNITLANGLLSVEGGVSYSGVSIEMVMNIREMLITLSSLLQSMEGTAALDIPEIEIEYSKAQSLLKYLRATRKGTAPNISGD
jgi:hypothetical protein